MAVSRVNATDRDIRPAASDLSDKLFHVVKLVKQDGVSKVDLAGVGDLVYGAISATCKPTEGGTTVDLEGLVKVKAGGNVAAGAQVSAGAGGVVVAAPANSASFGVAREDAVAGQIFAVQVVRSRTAV